MIGSIVHLLSRLVTKSNKIAWQGLHGALVNLVMAYEFDKLLQDDDIWIVDSGASHHVVGNKKQLQKAIPCGSGIRQVRFLGETKSHITHTGDAYLPIKTNRPSTIRLWGAFCDPYSGHNLVSVSRLTTDLPMLSFEFYPTEFLLKNVKTKKVIAKGPQTRNLYLWPHPKVEAWVARTKSDSRGQLIRASTVIKALWKLMMIHLCSLMIHLRALMCCSNNLQARVTNSWLADTGAQLHASFDETIIQNLNSFKAKGLVVRDVCGGVEAVTRFGDVYLQSQRLCSKILIHGVVLVPKATFNVLSVSMLTSDHPSYFRFAENGFVMKRLDTNKVIAKGTKRNKLYYWGNDH